MKNPAVNRYLVDKAMDDIDHALGRPKYPLKATYRNYFATTVNSREGVAFDLSPHWARTGMEGTMAYFHVTDIGRKALAEYLADRP